MLGLLMVTTLLAAQEPAAPSISGSPRLRNAEAIITPDDYPVKAFDTSDLAVRLLACPNFRAGTQLPDLLGQRSEIEGDERVSGRVKQSCRQRIVLHPDEHLEGARVECKLIGLHRH